MARVVFPDAFLSHTEGQRELQTEARNVRELLSDLKRQFPQLVDQLDKAAVAIDGQIYQDAFLEPIQADSEVFFMARIEGG